MGWKQWNKRLREHIEAHGLKQGDLGAALEDAGGEAVSQGAVGHWLHGRRSINLDTFFQLCEAAGADPARILFGEDMQRLVSARLQTAFSQSALENPDYAPFEGHLKKVPKPRKSKAIAAKRVRRKVRA